MDQSELVHREAFARISLFFRQLVSTVMVRVDLEVKKGILPSLFLIECARTLVWMINTRGIDCRLQ